jgi:hypothetical protein
MSKLDQKPTTDDKVPLEPAAADPGYMEWRDAKVRAALKKAMAHPENRVPQSDVWKRFGLET